MKKIIFFLFCIVVSVGTLFATAQSEASDGATVGFSISTLNNPFFVTLVEGAEEKARELGLELIVLDAQDDASKQLNAVEDLIRSGVDVILINPTDSDAVVSVITAANEAGIPVITVDRSASGGMVTSHVASDNVAGGVLAGEYLLSVAGNDAIVVELEGVPGASATRDRGKGFNQAVSSKVNIVARQTANFNRAEGLSVMENILQANQNVEAVFAHNDEMALGAVRALEAAGMSDVIVVGFDATDDAVQAVKDGAMAATIAQKPALIGSLSVEAAGKIINGETVEKIVNVALALVD